MSYSELSVVERATIQLGQVQGFSLRGIAHLINRSPSTISRELRRNRDAYGGYSARSAQWRMRCRRQVCRPTRKLMPGTKRFELVTHMLRESLSPGQIAGKLRSMNMPSLRDADVCRETIYNAIYALLVGELRKELIICLRQGKTARRPRSGGVDQRGQIPEMVSIHVRLPEIEDRLMPGIGRRPDQGQGQRLVCRHAGRAHQWLPDVSEDGRRDGDLGDGGLQCSTQ